MSELTKEIRHGVPVKLDADGRVVEFWIRRENWCRGDRRTTPSALMVDDFFPHKGTMCCMGHFSIAIGHVIEEIKGVSYYPAWNPVEKVRFTKPQGVWMTDARDLAAINDSSEFSGDEREAKIQNYFMSLLEPVTVHFCDGIPPEFKEAANA